MPFDIKQLRYALVAADHGSFYRAARALEVEQSTLSRAILKLERALGTDIFVRTRAGVTTTVAGARFLRSARPMVANADRMVATTRAAGQGRAGLLTIGMNSSISAGNMRATIVGWRHDNPDVELDGVEADRAALHAGLDTGEVDIAILMGEAGNGDYQRAAFWSERVFIALASDHPLSARQRLYWTDLCRERFILPVADPGPNIRDMLLGRLSQSGEHPDIRLHQVSRETILSLLGETRSLTVACEGTTGARFPNVDYRPVQGEQGAALMTYSGYWRADNSNPALRRFLAFIKARYALSF
jgi:DNA-binding transcriptional LysR family regulator